MSNPRTEAIKFLCAGIDLYRAEYPSAASSEALMQALCCVTASVGLASRRVAADQIQACANALLDTLNDFVEWTDA